MKENLVMPRNDSKTTTGTTTSTGLVRLNVNLNQETADALKELAESQSISLTEAVRRAIAISKFIENEQKLDRKIQTMDRYGKDKRELVLM